MMNLFISLFAVFSVSAYVPTVESLFRHGSNEEVTANGITLSLTVRKAPLPEGGSSPLLSEERADDYYRLHFTRSGDVLKVAQTRYSNASYGEAALLQKVFYPSLSASIFKPSVESLERGLFFALLHSLTTNNGGHMVSYLKALNVPVRLNAEIINRNKVELLADYKRYLVAVSRDRSAKKTAMNPLSPEDPAAKARAQAVMDEPMYVDTKHVKLAKADGEIAWVIEAGAFEAVFSYKERDLQRMRFRSTAGDFEVICKDYWLADGTHSFPRFMLLKTTAGQQYQVELTNLRHFVEREEDLVKRLHNWDQILKGRESQEPRPEFML